MVLNDSQIERIETEALRLLEEVGLFVETERVAELMCERGCKPLPNGRLRIPREFVLGVMAIQGERIASGKRFMPQREPPVEPRPNAVISSAFSHGPTRYYDIEKDRIVTATLDIGDQMLRLAAATPEVAMVSPDMAWVNAALREFFINRQGSHTGGTGTQYGATASRPGFQAVCENLYLAYAVARLEGRPATYQGAGQLIHGGVGCPEQLMIDIEVASAMDEVDQPTDPLTEDALALDALREVISEDKTFLDHEHTLAHMRKLWRPQVVQWGPPESTSERTMLERARDLWQDNLTRYQPPDWPEDILRELERVRLAARRELLGE